MPKMAKKLHIKRVFDIIDLIGLKNQAKTNSFVTAFSVLFLVIDYW